MINVDISNIWGDVSLQDLLALEEGIFQAHKRLTEIPGKGDWMQLPDALPKDLMKTANLIRLASDILVVIGDNSATRGIRAIIELLQGPQRNLWKGQGDPIILFTGDSLSPDYWNDLRRLLEGRDYSLCVIAGDSLNTESAIALRNLKWMLCRKYGTNDAMDRIYAVTTPGQGSLRRMAQQEEWKIFNLPAQAGDDFSLLSPGCWLPLAVAGIDVNALLQGAREAREEFDLRSFENPAWLYAAVRQLMGSTGKTLELLGSFEPGFAAMGRWWQQLFAGSEMTPAPFPVCYPGDLGIAEHLIRDDSRNFCETLIRFGSPKESLKIPSAVNDTDGLNALAGRRLDQVEEDCLWELVENHTGEGVGVLTIECEELSEKALGYLVWFFLLSRALTDPK